MTPTRRETLWGLSSLALSSSAFACLPACTTGPRRESITSIAILAPLTGRGGDVGPSVERAARLAAGDDVTLLVLDTGSTSGGAREAASRAAEQGAELIVGPVFAEEARAVSTALPVITLSNDASIDGAYVLGVTARQSVGTILPYARDRGVRTVAMVASGSAWSKQCEAAAREGAAAETVLLIGPVDGNPDADLASALRAAGEGRLPNAVLIPEGGVVLERVSAQLAGLGVQLLGTSQWSSRELASPAARGAWIAAPSPDASSAFAASYARRHEETPGVIAALAFDAVAMAVLLARTTGLTRAGIARAEGFAGALGPFRFQPNGQAERRLAILIASASGGVPVPGGLREWA